MIKKQIERELRALQRKLQLRDNTLEEIERRYIGLYNNFSKMIERELKREVMAFVVLYKDDRGKEQKRLFLTRNNAAIFATSLIPGKHGVIRLEPLYLT